MITSSEGTRPHYQRTRIEHKTMDNAQTTINEIRANMATYSDEDMHTLRGRLTLNMYGAEVSEALAGEVISECARRREATNPK